MPMTRRTVLIAAPMMGAAGAGAGASQRDPAALVHSIDADTTIASAVAVTAGEHFVIARGVTLTLTGDFAAPATQIFHGEGHVDLTRSRVLGARPEWWGAVPNDPSVDCEPALSACVAAHLVTLLGAGDYWIARTWTIARSNRRVVGIGRSADVGGTRLVLRGGEGVVLRVGTVRSPGAIDEFVRGVELHGFGVGRSAAPMGTAVGVEIAHVLDCEVSGVWAHEHDTAFSITAAVRSFLRNCAAFRAYTGSKGIFVGYDMGGKAWGLAGVNASLYLIDCTARTGGQPVLAASYGIRMRGAIADTTIVRFETVELTHAIDINGQRATLSAAERRLGHADVRIEAPVLDQCTGAGITITGLSDYAAVEVTDPYVALSTGGTSAIEVSDSGGAIDIRGGQILGWVATGAGGNALGIGLRGVSGLTVTRLKIVDFRRPLVAEGLRNFDIAVTVNGQTPVPVALALAGCANGSVRPVVTGAAGAFETGVAITRSTSVGVDVAAIDPRVASRRVTVDGVTGRTPGGRVFAD